MTANEFFDTWLPVSTRNQLSLRETQVLKLILQGYSNKEIGFALYISSKTAGTHRTNAYRKLYPRTLYGNKTHRNLASLVFPLWIKFSEDYVTSILKANSTGNVT